MNPRDIAGERKKKKKKKWHWEEVVIVFLGDVLFIAYLENHWLLYAGMR